MSDEFDAYHIWLGIPPAEQPPHHYRLLGIPVFESNPRVIESAADRQMTFLRQHGAGEHGEASQRLLNQISKALVELLNPQRKAAYDAQLKQRLAPADTRDRAAAGPVTSSEAKAAFDAFEQDFVSAPVAGPTGRPVAASKSRQPLQNVDESSAALEDSDGPARRSIPLWQIGVGAGALLLVVVVSVFAMRKRDADVSVGTTETIRSIQEPAPQPALPESRSPTPPVATSKLSTSVKPSLAKPPADSPAVATAPTPEPVDTPKPPASPSTTTPVVATPDGPPQLVAPFDAAQARAHQRAWAKHLGVPVEFTNAVGMRFVLIPPHQYLRGSNDDDIARLLKQARLSEAYLSVERPQHSVIITKPYYMGKYEITVGQFRAFVDDTHYETSAERGHTSGAFVDSYQFDTAGGYTWKKPGYKQSDRHAVVNVSYNDVSAYCDWVTKKLGVTHRIPTEAEWEQSNRAGTVTLFSQGDTLASVEGYANVADTTLWELHGKPNASPYATFSDGFPHTAPVGCFLPNPFGIHDMHGNVWERCADDHDVEAYRKVGSSIAVDPNHGQNTEQRAVRGGGWINGPEYSRSTERSRNPSLDYSGNHVGSRVVLEIPSSKREELVDFVRSAGRATEFSTGMTGRIRVDDADSGFATTYFPGRSFGGKYLKTLLPKYDAVRQTIRIDLVGEFELESEETIALRHTGGGGSDNRSTVWIDGQEISELIEKGSRDVVREVPLSAGPHQIRWIIRGGVLGTGNQLELKRSESGEEIAIHHIRPDSSGVDSSSAKKGTALIVE
jgi:formylglycine-generating enzyme required for sulfatase activity